MRIHSLRLQHVRSHSDSSFELGSGVNVLVGPNACGKTTVLEAISLASRGMPAPGQRLKHTVQRGQEWLRIDMQVNDSQRVFKYELSKPLARSFQIDDQVFKRLSQDQIVPIVWFDPEELRLLRGSPSRRREYLDGLLSQIDPHYRRALNQFNRALQQRNALLKNPRSTVDQFFVWNIRFTEHAKQIQAARDAFIVELQQKLQQTYCDLSGSQADVRANHQSLVVEDYSKQLMSLLELNLQRDRILGHTSVGPHRDDLLIDGSDGRSFGETASRGEIRTLVLALKVIEVEKLQSVFGVRPVLLFDDVFSELDGSRRHAFTDYLASSQTIITTTDADIVSKDFAQHAKVIALDAKV